MICRLERNGWGLVEKIARCPMRAPTSTRLDSPLVYYTEATESKPPSLVSFISQRPSPMAIVE